jgi:hypothetical protein
MSEFHAFDPDEIAGSFEFSGDFDFDADVITQNHDHAVTPALVPSRLAGSSPNASDGSAVAEQLVTADANQNFPVLLHGIVSNDQYECIQWLPCGTLFAISNKEAFTTQVIPKFFDARGGTKFTSFTRRLKRWNFNRISSGTNIGSYYHENFIRGRPDMAAAIMYPTKVTKKGSPATIVKSKVKARRRASTGCMVEPEKSTDFGCTPIPVKPSVQVCASPGLFDLDSDMAELLASPDFVNDDEPNTKGDATDGVPSTPPFSPSLLGPAPVTDDTSNEILGISETIPTSTQSEKLHMVSSYQPRMKSALPLQASSQSLLHNTSLDTMRHMQPLAFPGLLNANQMQQQQQVLQRPVFQPQMRRHSCMPVFGANNLDSSSLFGTPNVAMGMYNHQIPMHPNSAFNPMLHVNNIPLNQNIVGQNLMVNMKSSEFPEQKLDVVTPRTRGVTTEDIDQEDKWIDFDEYVSRQDD